MTKTKSTLIFGVAGAALLGCLFLGAMALTAKANALFFPVVTQSAAATSTQIFVAAGGSATSTPVDAFTSTNQGFDRMSFLIQSVASTTGATTTITFQYAIGIGGTNCATSPNACDWYSDELFSSKNGAVATTSTPVGIGTAISFTFPAANTATSSRILDVPTPTRYVRAVITVAGAQSGFWYAWQPVRQSAQ